MACAESPVVVLLPIKPCYAEPIMAGRKRVEFRKTIFARAPSHVVVYASSPVKQVLGYFEVSGIDVDRVDALWTKHARAGGIAEDEFARYFYGRDAGVAIGIGCVVPAERPMGLTDLGLGRRPPQSFMYIDAGVIGRLQGGAKGERHRAHASHRVRLHGRCRSRAQLVLEIG